MLNLYEKIKEIEKEYTKDYIPNNEELQLQAVLNSFYNIDNLDSEREYNTNNLYFYIFMKEKNDDKFLRYCFTLSKINPKRKSTCPAYFIIYRLAQIENYNMFFKPNIFFRIFENGEVKEGGSKNDLVCLSNVYFIDIDNLEEDISKMNYNDIDKLLYDKYKFYKIMKPNIIIKSGGGLHLYWRLWETEDLYKSNYDTAIVRNKHNQIERILINLFDSDPNCKDLSRMLRVPFSYNYKSKYKEPRKIEVFFPNFYNQNELDFNEFLEEFTNSESDYLEDFAPYSQDEFYNEIFNNNLIKNRVSEIIKNEICNFKIKQSKSVKWKDLIADLETTFNRTTIQSIEDKKERIELFNEVFKETCKKYFAYNLLTENQKSKYKKIYTDYFIIYVGYNPNKKIKAHKDKKDIKDETLQKFKVNGKKNLLDLCNKRIHDLELWFSLHKNDLKGFRHNFFYFYINILKTKGVSKSKIKEKCFELYNSQQDKFGFVEIQRLIDMENIYRFSNLEIAETLQFTEEEIKHFKSTYTPEELEINKQINIDKQNKKKVNKISTDRKIKKENKWETIKNILLNNADKTNKELINILYLMLNIEITDRTLRNYKSKLKVEINGNRNIA